MSSISLNDTLLSRQFKYLLKTSLEVSSPNVVSTLFRDGTIINLVEINPGGRHSVDELSQFVEQVHLQRKKEFALLFKLSQSFIQTTNHRLAVLVGTSLLRKNLFDEALNFLSDVVEKMPQDDDVLFCLGKAHYKKNSFELAEKFLQKAVELKPDYADYRTLLGQIYFERDACSRAGREFEKAISLNIYYAEAHYWLGLTYIKNAIVREDYELSVNLEENAIKAFETAVQLNSAYKQGTYFYGLEAIKKKNYQQALENFLETHKIIKKPDPRALIDNFYLTMVDQDEELDITLIWDYIKKLKTTITSFPNYVDLYNDLGIAYSIMGVCFQKDAIKYFDKALQGNANYIKANRHRKLITNENRGLDFLLDTLLELQVDCLADNKKRLKIEFF
ncbi:tetratricopeptide repeat protein [candidate division KSB1 bacterium]|nr:tetratricopeptide repeat protein [candidate division KSB1 bacterium]